MQLKIGQKLLIVLLGITILSTASVFISGYIVSSRSLTGKVEEELKLSLKRSSEDVDNFLQGQQSEAKALAEMPWLKELLGSLKSGNYGGFIKNRGLMEQFFLEHQKNRKAIQAIRVVDTRGQVLIKVKELKVIDKNKQHPFFPVTSVGSLSEKNFFSELLKLGKGQVWMSNFEMGIDNNEFCPPMIRIAVSISLNDNVIAGFLVINIWGQRIGEIVNNTITKDDGHSFVVERNVLDPERNGIYLHHHDSDICFLNQTGKGSTFFKDYPDAARLMDKNRGVIRDPSSRNLIAYVYYSPYMSQERGWLIVTVADRDRALAPIIKQKKVMLTVGVIILMAAAVTAILLSKTLTNPISLLSAGAKEIGSGNLDYRIDVSSGDEIGDLAIGFNSMSQALKENINRRIHAESRACQAEKLASIGELAAGVAHEINNPLGNIISTAKLLGEDINRNGCDVSAIKTDINTIIKEGRRGERIVTGLLNFSREMPLHKTSEDLPVLIDEVIISLNNRIQDKGIIIYRQYNASSNIRVDRAQMQQVFSNIILNSIHATGEGGNIRIETRMRGDNVEVEISDTGVGIPEENFKKVFNPFFTTKEVGEGTGLGLAVSYGIIKKHNGEIILENNEGKGTRCIITLPLNGMSHA
ncbi:MAG: sensor histidine kinase [Nitrospirae bacterium]|nr:sensor histidine kinase [Nitrospirota bacterium]